MVLIQTTIDRNFGDLAYAIYRQTDRSAHLSQTERKALQSLKNSVLLAWVQPLETYLKNQQWREAGLPMIEVYRDPSRVAVIRTER